MRTLGKVNWGARIKSIQDEEDGVVARFEDGSSVTGELLASLLRSFNLVLKQ